MFRHIEKHWKKEFLITDFGEDNSITNEMASRIRYFIDNCGLNQELYFDNGFTYFSYHFYKENKSVSIDWSLNIHLSTKRILIQRDYFKWNEEVR